MGSSEGAKSAEEAGVRVGEEVTGVGLEVPVVKAAIQEVMERKVGGKVGGTEAALVAAVAALLVALEVALRIAQRCAARLFQRALQQPDAQMAMWKAQSEPLADS